MSATNVADLATTLASAMPALDRADQRLALGLYRLLARGVPVSADELARATDRPLDEVTGALADWPGVFRDDTGAIIGFWGLALSEMPHRLEVDATRLYAWCAWDTLFLPQLIGAPATVESRDPSTGEPIRLTVGKHEVRNVEPQSTVVSFLRPEREFDARMVESFCHFVHFFGSESSARAWTAKHPETFTLSLADAFELGQLTNRAKFGDALAR